MKMMDPSPGRPCCAGRCKNSAKETKVDAGDEMNDKVDQQCHHPNLDAEEEEDFDDNDNEDPWVYRGKKLQALNFPLGGFGCGNILLQGDGTLQGWTVMNQFHNPDHTPLHKLPGNMFALSASWDEEEDPRIDDEEDEEENTENPATAKSQEKNNIRQKLHHEETFILQSPENYTRENQMVHHSEERHVTHQQVHRLKMMKSLMMTKKMANNNNIKPGDGSDEENDDNTTSDEQRDGTVEDKDASKPGDGSGEENDDNTTSDEQKDGTVEDEDEDGSVYVTNVEMKCQYPIANVKYTTVSPGDKFPIGIEMEAMTPFVPNDAKGSSFPIAYFRFKIKNRSSESAVSIDLMQSTLNFVGWDGHTDCCHTTETPFWGHNVNTPFAVTTTSTSSSDDGTSSRDNANDQDSLTKKISTIGLSMTNEGEIKEKTRHGSIALAAICEDDDSNGPDVSLIMGTRTEKELLESFVGRDFEDPTKASPTPPSADGKSYIGAVVQSMKIPPKTTKKLCFVLSWYFPNRPCTAPRETLPKDIWGNRYSTWFTNAKDVACQFSANLSDLVATTRLFVEILYQSTIPWEVLESAAGRMACLRSPTMFWTADGRVLGNEGNECCPLNCSHVYGYTTLMESLFPELAKDMRTSDFVRNYVKGQGVSMRYGVGGFAIDGSLASVIKTYLVVQKSDPNGDFLKTVWPSIKEQLDILFKMLDKDGVIRSPQQNTYDSSMEGANTFIGSYVVSALKAATKMAAIMGDVNYMKKTSKQAEVSAVKYESLCWREDFSYYVADVDESNCENSYSNGCFIDHLCASSLSLACGLGTAFDPDHEARARRWIARNNIVQSPPFHDNNNQFYFGDKGICVCSYPNGKVGGGSMPYSNLVSTGFEYPVAAAMIHDGNWSDTRKICRMIRARQSGVHRSPWNEPECGMYYARSMAAWNLYDQACGFTYDCTQSLIAFQPKINQTDFSCCFVFNGGFGKFTQTGDESDLSWGSVSLLVLHAISSDSCLQLKSIQLQTNAHVVEVDVDKSPIDSSIDPAGLIQFSQPISLKKGSILSIRLSSPCCTNNEKLVLNERNDNDDEKRTMKVGLFLHLVASCSTMWVLISISVVIIWLYSCKVHTEMQMIKSYHDPSVQRND